MFRPSHPLAIVFDYGGTLVISEECHFERGIQKLLTISTNPNHVTADNILNAFKNLDNEIEIINTKFNIEASFKSYYRYIFEKFHVTFQNSYEQLEKIFRKEIYEYKPTTGILELLTYLENHHIKIGILSNNEFSGNVLNEEIEVLFPKIKFEFFISSSDYFFRKPSTRLFEISKSKLCLTHDIWYAGDNFDVDVIGATNAGMIPVWYNPFNQKGNNDYKYISIKNWTELMQYL